MAESPDRDPRAPFPPTRRSRVAAMRSDDPAERARSFDFVVRAYWKPVYTHVRLRWRRSPEEARDLTQGFFSRALEKATFASYDPAKALFRTFVKMCVDRYVMEAARDAGRQKRGGVAEHLRLDFDLAEHELQQLGPGAGGVDACFDAAWTRALLGDAVEALEKLCADKGKSVQLTVFRRYVLDAPDDGARPSYASLAGELGISVSDVTNYLSWTRREFRRLVLETLRELTVGEEEFRAEARALLGAEP